MATLLLSYANSVTGFAVNPLVRCSDCRIPSSTQLFATTPPSPSNRSTWASSVLAATGLANVIVYGCVLADALGVSVANTPFPPTVQQAVSQTETLLDDLQAQADTHVEAQMAESDGQTFFTMEEPPVDTEPFNSVPSESPANYEVPFIDREQVSTMGWEEPMIANQPVDSTMAPLQQTQTNDGMSIIEDQAFSQQQQFVSDITAAPPTMNDNYATIPSADASSNAFEPTPVAMESTQAAAAVVATSTEQITASMITTGSIPSVQVQLPTAQETQQMLETLSSSSQLAAQNLASVLETVGSSTQTVSQSTVEVIRDSRQTLQQLQKSLEEMGHTIQSVEVMIPSPEEIQNMLQTLDISEVARRTSVSLMQQLSELPQRTASEVQKERFPVVLFVSATLLRSTVLGVVQMTRSRNDDVASPPLQIARNQAVPYFATVTESALPKPPPLVTESPFTRPPMTRESYRMISRMGAPNNRLEAPGYERITNDAGLSQTNGASTAINNAPWKF